MRNSNIIRLAFGLMLIGLFGCKKLLTEKNPSGNTAETVYTTAAGYETLVAAAYSYTRSWYGKEDGFGLSEAGTDLWTAGSETFIATSGLALDNRALILYQNLSPVNANITRLWRQLYAAVNLCNKGIKINSEGDYTPPKSTLAEVHFLRAFYYWHIVETWGGVHFSTDPTLVATSTANRTPEEIFYDQIIADLLIAVNDLPDAPSSTYGRANKQVAKAFLARVYLTRGYKDSKYFPLAKDMADQVISSNKYTLADNYSDLWDMKNQKGSNLNKEVIWSVNYSTDLAKTSDVYNEVTNPNGYGVDILSANGNATNNRGNNNAHALFIPGYDRASKYTANLIIVRRDVRYHQPFIRFKPTKFLLQLYDETKDQRYKGSFQTVWKFNTSLEGGRGANKLKGKKGVINAFDALGNPVTDPAKWTLYPFAQRDTALLITKGAKTSPNYYTVDVFDTYNADGSSKGQNIPENYMFPALLKFQDSTTRSTSPDDLGSGNIQSAKDIFVIRYAEMYLISAEASVGMNDNAGAVSRLNELRTKRAIKGKETQMQISAGDVSLDFILDERAREFAGEQIRWFDLKRTGSLVRRVKAYNPDAGASIQPFHTLRPIPQQQMDVVTNKGEFTQNPNY